MGKRGVQDFTLYKCVHSRLNSKVNGSRILSKKEVFRILGELYHVPKSDRHKVLKEMEELGMIKNLSKNGGYHQVEILPFDDMEY